MIVSQIAAMSQNRIIGKNNTLPWKLPADMKYFKDTTNGHVVIMGRKNFEAEGKPLKNRTNIVISHKKDFQATGCINVLSIDEALKKAREIEHEEIFIIGGGIIYKHTLHLTDKIYLTVIHEEFEGDVFFPQIDLNHWKEKSKRFYPKDKYNPYDHTYFVYVKK